MKELRFGVLGWGYWGPKISRNLNTLPNAVVSMVADTDAHRLASLRIHQPGLQTTTQVNDIFRSNVDAVVIATPVRTHYMLAKEALLHGKHVLVEKPLTANVTEAEELVALAAQQQRVLMVGHTFEYNPAVNELRKMVQSGDLGKIYCVEAERLNLGLFRYDINVIWDLAPHDLSIFDFVLGMEPRSVSAWGCAHADPAVENIAYVNLDYWQLDS